MKTTGGATKVSSAQTPAKEEKVRKSLHILQPAATNKESLVGGGRTLRSSMSLKEESLHTLQPAIKDKENFGRTLKSLKEESKKTENSVINIKNEATKKKAISAQEKSVQTGRDIKEIKIEAKDLTSKSKPSESYWEVLAERRRIALAETLEQNLQFSERISILEEENQIYKEELDECKALIQVLKEMIGEDDNSIDDSLLL